MRHDPPAQCASCPAYEAGAGGPPGEQRSGHDHVVALAGNPNTGKSTVFNALTGLRQHTGNWPGKTVARAVGSFSVGRATFELVDLPGTYSLLSTSLDEQIARDFVLFGRPDVTVIVVDATRLERNLNLVLQVLEITDRAVVCLNLVDEAERRGLEVDERRLARDLGVPVVATAARYGRGLDELRRTVAAVARGEIVCRPLRVGARTAGLDHVVSRLAAEVTRTYPAVDNPRWVALRLLDGDRVVAEAVRSGGLGVLGGEENLPLVAAVGGGGAVPLPAHASPDTEALFDLARRLRWQVDRDLHETVVEGLYAEASRLAQRAVTASGERTRFDWERTVDRLVTSRTFGLPIMLLLLAGVLWITITGANVPSQMLSALLLDTVHPALKAASAALGVPWWLDGLVIDGMYLATAWVVSVMLPPMAIFFPLFTLLEDLGYLPRVAFNLDSMFRRVGAHGKQALTMAMGWGCNAAAIVSTRIIDSPRERLIAIVTNNFALCNGRWPTQILVATIFLGALVPPYLAGLVSAGAVVAVALLGVALTFAVSWLLSRTVLRGEVSTFHLELPPYRPPRILRTIATSIVDRTLVVLWRAVVFALPAGAVIWLLSNVTIGGVSLAERAVRLLDPFGAWVGLSGVILLAYLIAIPANEIVIPTILMLTVLLAGRADLGGGPGVMFALDSTGATGDLLRAGGWTVLMAVNLMLFSLVHNPCSTTLFTIWKETRSAVWTVLSALLPLGLGLLLCFVVAQVWRLVVG